MGIEPTNPSNPVAGADLTFTIAAGKTQVLRSLAFGLNTSATVADRYVRLAIDNGSGLTTYFYGENNVPQVAGVTCYYSFALGYHPVVTAPGTNGGYRAFCLPDLILQPGWRVYTVTQNIDTGDQIAFVTYELQDVWPIERR